ncbi:putative ferric-chelate reductase 1 [Amphibalanus amphitrite]|uniref:Putative ferric-chelate reductase 1 n=1 Tax=Amphibalanus amphitrite TaxID=1232801 RepID=A0A6A4VPH6_AMPAM|nr:putative ferric-chelate reductase 1 [Amphibalanus amphitrite]
MMTPRRMTLLTGLLAALLAAGCGYHMGAPETACSSMVPGHGSAPQQTAMPYTVSVSNTTLRQGRRLMVNLKRGQLLPFKGFFVQARRVRDPNLPAVGRFYTKQHALVRCGSTPASSITHADGKPKDEVTLLWESPDDLDEDVEFRVTMVQNFQTFWVGGRSEPVRVSASGREPPQPAAAAAAAPAPAATTAVPDPEEDEEHDMTDILVGSRRKRPGRTTTEAPCSEDCEQPTTSAALSSRSGISSVFDDCLLSKGCFARTAGCIQERNCDLMVTYRRLRSGQFRMQLFGRYQPGRYLAVGLSDDRAMGDDAVIYCASTNDGRFQILHAYNFGHESSIPIRASSKEGLLVSDVTSQYRDGLLICEFTHSARFTIRGQDFDLGKDGLHLMIASGTTSADVERRPQYHLGTKRVTGAPVPLSSSAGGARVYGAASDSGTLYRAHGALMIVAWLGTASLGMMLARYFKQTWVGRKVAGLDLWFVAHRNLMVLTVLCSLAGLVCILVQLEGWTSTPTSVNPHPLLGIICIALAFVQPFMALFRCAPTASRRPVFNWLHWLVGSAAHLLGIITIFLAVTLPAAQLPFWTYWVLAAFVVMHVVTHLVLSTQQCAADRAARQKNSSEAYSMRDMGANGVKGGPSGAQGDAQGSTLRRLVLAVYTLATLTVVILLVVMVTLAPADAWGQS